MVSEYDISVDAEEPLQVISFVPDRRRSSKTFNAIDSAEREVVSFTLGKGMADWGPLTIYALMKNRDVYAVCPYMPKNAYVTLYFNAVLSERRM
jgi:nucleoporin NUP82